MSNTDTDALATRIEELAAGVAAEHGAEIYDVEVRRHGATGTVRLVVDRASGADADAGGITIGEVTRVAKEVGYLLDAEDLVPFTYTFEVTSPGIERPLRKPRHYERNLGEEVRLVLSRETEDGRKVVEGRLEGIADGAVTVVDAAGNRTMIRVEDVRRGRTVFDFDAGKAGKK